MSNSSKNKNLIHNSKNAVVVTAIGNSKMWDIGKKSIEKFCKKYNIAFEIITEKKYATEYAADDYHYVNFEKNQVYDLFDKYDRILRLDWDIIITPHCPNVFEIVQEEKIGVVFEDIGSRKKDRLNRIKMIQDQLGDLDWRSDYFNSGVVMASKQHREIYKTTPEDVEIVLNLKTPVSKEQNYLNYKVRKFRFEIYELNYKYNHTRLFSEPWNGRPERYKSFIIHYAGKKQEGLKKMRIDYNILFLHKPKPFDLNNFLKAKFSIVFSLINSSKIIIGNKDLTFMDKIKSIMSILLKKIRKIFQ